MEKLLKDRQFFYILTLFFIAGFLVYPNISFADEFDDIILRETAKHIELPGGKVQDLIRSFISIFHSEWENLAGSGYISAEKMAVPSIMKKAVQVQALNHLLIDAPIEITWAIIKNTVKMTRLFLGDGFGSIFEEIEKESVKRATAYGIDALFENEIRVSPGTLGFEYELREGGTGKALIQYIMIYNPSDNKNGEMIVKFYSSNSLKIPKNEMSYGGAWGIYTELEHDLSPFIVDVRGNVQDYKWIGKPSIDIDFPPEVPDLGIKLLTPLEKYLLKPIETMIKEVEIIITKVTGKPPGFTDIWNEVKKFIEKIKSFAPAGLTESLQIEEVQPLVDTASKLLTITETAKGLVEAWPQQANEAIEDSVQQIDEQDITLAELQEILDDAAEQLDVLSQQIVELNRAKLEESAELNQVQEETEEVIEEIEKEEIEELVKEKEIVEESPQQISEDICWVDINAASKEELQKITGIGPVLAQRIIEARPFYSLNDLIKVSGIGEVTLQKILNQGCAYVIYIGGGGDGGGSPYTPPPPELEETPPSSSTSTPVKILITEIKILSIGERFVELYNSNNETVNLDGWYIQRKTVSATDWSSFIPSTKFEGKSIQPREHFLVASSTEADILLGLTLTEDNSLVLKNPNREIVDLVGWGNAQSFETATATAPVGGKSIGRKWSTTSQIYIDTDNNQNDFEIQTPTPRAQNQNSAPLENQVPNASFIFIPAEPIINQEILFDASSSGDYDGTIISYIWDFGDSTTSTEIKATTTHSYSTSSEFIIVLQAVDNEEDTSSATSSILVTEEEGEEEEGEEKEEKTPTLEVVINEIAWMGTSATNSADEWIELYNNTDSIIDLANWSFIWSHGTTSHNIIFSTSTGLTTVIPANGYFLLERSEDNKAISDILYDQFFTGALYNDGEKLELRNANGILIDIIDCFSGWFAGTITPGYISMERIDSATSGTSSVNWANNNLITRNGLDVNGNKISGTPKAENSVSKSETEILPANRPPFDEFDELTLTYLGSPYIFKYYLQVPAEKTLNIEPGVILKFDSSWVSWGAEIDGTLKAIGEENKKIIFTSLNEPTHWNGIYFSASSAGSELNWAEIRYGRRNPKLGLPPAILIENSSISMSSSTIENYTDRGIKLINSSSTIENVSFLGPGIGPTIIGLDIEQGNPTIKNSYFKNNRYGISINQKAYPLVENNNFEDNEIPIWLNYNSSFFPTFKNNIGDGNQKDVISIRGIIPQDTIWEVNFLPYFVYDFIEVSENTILTIKLGVRVEFNNDAYIKIDGNLTAEGTLEEPIIFTSLNIPAYWGGLFFSSTSQNSILENVIIEYGGHWNPFWYIWGSVSVVESSIEFRNSTSSNSSWAGIYLENSSSTIENSYFGNSLMGMRIQGTEKLPQLVNNSFGNNQKYDIYWPNSGGSCGEIATSSPGLTVECGCCPY